MENAINKFADAMGFIAIASLLVPFLVLLIAFPIAILTATGLAIAPSVPTFLALIAAPIVARNIVEGIA